MYLPWGSIDSSLKTPALDSPSEVICTQRLRFCHSVQFVSNHKSDPYYMNYSIKIEWLQIFKSYLHNSDQSPFWSQLDILWILLAVFVPSLHKAIANTLLFLSMAATSKNGLSVIIPSCVKSHLLPSPSTNKHNVMETIAQESVWKLCKTLDSDQTEKPKPFEKSVTLRKMFLSAE